MHNQWIVFNKESVLFIKYVLYFVFALLRLPNLFCERWILIYENVFIENQKKFTLIKLFKT